MLRMTIRVAQVATGNAGTLTLRQLITDDRFELVAVSTSNPEKVGQDAGELAGLAVTTGIAAVGDLDARDRRPARLSSTARWATPGRSRRPATCALLEAGIDVVGSAPARCSSRGEPCRRR